MTNATIRLAELSFEDVAAYARDRAAKNPQYLPALNRLPDAFDAAKAADLRFNRKTWILRDNRLGVLSRPSNPNDFPEAASWEDAVFDLAKSVWCDAVRAHNLAAA